MDIINYYDLLKTIYFIVLTFTSKSFCKNYVGCFSVPVFFILLKYTIFSKNYNTIPKAWVTVIVCSLNFF